MAHMTASVIFSPSIARQQLAAAKDWNYIDGWLTTKFNGKPAPPFERNNDTLKALLALAALNETADEERDLLSKVEAKALAELQCIQTGDPNTKFLMQLQASLTREGYESLNALTNAGVVLSQPFADPEEVARKIFDLQVTSLSLDQASERVAILENHLRSELESVNSLLDELRSEAYETPSGLAKQTVEYQRKTKLLATKLLELKDRVGSLAALGGTPKPTIQDITGEEDKYRESLTIVKGLESRVGDYHGLPHDTDLARLEVQAIRVELQKLKKQRDGMFEGLVERASPIKRRS